MVEEQGPKAAPNAGRAGLRAGLRARSVRRGRLVRALVEHAAVGPAGGDLEQELQRCAEALAAVAGLARVVVFLVDGTSGELWPAAAVGVTDEQLEALRQDPESPGVVRSRLLAAPVGRRTLQDEARETLVVPLRDADGGWTGMVAADLGSAPPDGLTAAAVELFADRAEAQVVRAQLDEVLARLALVDLETGLINRQGFEDALARELVRAERNGRPCAVMALRVDGARGAAGLALAERAALTPAIAATLRRRLRRADLPARLDATTFAALLPETLESAARVVAEDLRARAGRIAAPEPQLPSPTVSVGIACSSGRGSSVAGLLGAAGGALEQAAAAGGDRVAYV